jgi:hypothetical protein
MNLSSKFNCLFIITKAIHCTKGVFQRILKKKSNKQTKTNQPNKRTLKKPDKILGMAIGCKIANRLTASRSDRLTG